MKPYIALFCLCAVLFFWKLGDTPLIGLDEGLYAECSREMLASGDYLVPTCGGQPFYDKPPMCYWLQAASMRVFGANSLGARFPSAVAALLLVAVTVYLGTRLFDRRTGLFAGFALATCGLTLGSARLCTLDALFSLTIAFSLGAFILARTRAVPRGAYLVFWAAAGLSTLVKGPAGAVLIFAAAGAYLVVTGRLRELVRPGTLVGIAVFAAVVVPWYAMVQSATGGAFLREFIVHHNLQRAAGQDFGHNMPFYFYVPAFLAGFFPWSVFVPAAWSTQVSRRFKDPAGEAALFAGVWALSVLVIFSLLASKLASYIFPAYVPSALLVGRFWSRAVDGCSIASIRRCGWVLLGAGAVLCVGMLIAPRLLRDPMPGLSVALVPMSVCVFLGSVAGLVLVLRKRATAAFAAFAGGMGGFLAAAAVIALPIAARTLSGPAVEAARRVRTCTTADACVIAYRLSPPQPAISFYARRPIRTVTTAAELGPAIDVDAVTYVIAQRDRLAGLPRDARTVSTLGRYVVVEVRR